MKKILFALLMLLMLAAACLGCAEEAAVTEDVVLATAYNGEITVTHDEVMDEFDQMLESYISYYAQYGYEMDEYDTELQNAVAQETVYSKLSQRIAERYAKDNGFAMTEEQEAELRAKAETTMDSMREYFANYLSAYGLTGDELTAAVEQQLAASGYTADYLVESGKLSAVLDHIYNLHTVDVTVTEEEVKAAFDAKIEAAKTAYADADAYIGAFLNGEEILYTPEGMRNVQVIFINPTDEAAAETTGKAKADAAKAEIDGGKDFVEVMAAYSDEGLTQEQLVAGYAVTEGCTSYSEEFLAAAMALENAGDVSDVVETAYGYFIIRYVAEIPAGPVAYEGREVAETEEALTAKKDEVYTAAVDKMILDAGVVMNDLSPLFHVYVPQVIEATVAYATVEAETQLTDMPEGDAVATLSAGASLDVLGRIGMDGEEYAFVAVPGTAFKGYVNVTAMKDMDAEAALAVDNTALVTAQTVEGKKPTFTVAMNDGSLIYGELYPEIAPESVGNFVSLAGAGFYDNLIFHRVIAGFMIQGGDPNGDGTGGPGYSIKGEFTNNGVENNLSHSRGVLSMARSSAMDSAGSQFFIMHADSTHLDGDYAAFGMVLGGIETVDLIASQPTNSNDRPMNDQTIRTVYVETYGQTYEFTKLED